MYSSPECNFSSDGSTQGPNQSNIQASYWSNIQEPNRSNIQVQTGVRVNPRRPVDRRATEGDICFGCGDAIADRYLLRVSGRSWHEQCLRCCVCQAQLERQTTCFIKSDNIYCRVDYTREFGAKCSKCLRHIQPNDWVRRARECVYHLACFACDSCKRQLSTGEEFALHDSRVLCKSHYVEMLEGGPCKDSDSNQKAKTKRVRTTFTEEQIQVLQANFQLDSNPDGQDLERIAQITGLSKRVTQVWFQNSRARQKKYQQLQKGDNCRSVSPRDQLTIITDDQSPQWSSGEECGSSGLSFME